MINVAISRTIVYIERAHRSHPYRRHTPPTADTARLSPPGRLGYRSAWVRVSWTMTVTVTVTITRRSRRCPRYARHWRCGVRALCVYP